MSTDTLPLTDAKLYAIEKKAAADLAEIGKYTDEDWKKIHASLDAKYRAKYKKEAAEYREEFGVEPSLGTLMGAEMRAECNHMTEEEEAEAFAYGMAIYHASPAKPYARLHARLNATRR